MEDKRQVAELKVAGKAVTTWKLVKGSKNKITLGCPQRKPCSCILKLMLDSRLPLEVAIRTFAQWGEASFMTQVPARRITENFAEVYKRIRRYYAPLLQRSIQPAPAYASHEQKHTASVQYRTWSHKLQKTMHLHSIRRLRHTLVHVRVLSNFRNKTTPETTRRPVHGLHIQFL